MAKEKLQIQIDVNGANAAKKSLNKMGTAVKGVGGSLSAMLGPIALVTTAIYAVKEGFQFAFEKGAEFEKGMANLKSISGSSAVELGKLSDKARELGGSTAYTSSQVSDLMTEYAKLGFNPEEIDAAAESTLKLAGAFGTDLATAAATAGGTVRAFGMDSTETQRVTDVMAASFSSSALDMSKFTESMKYVGPIAKAAGLDVEDATGILGELSNNMIHGSQAGTALRRILLEAGKEGSKLANAMGGPIDSMDDFKKGLRKLKDDGFDVMADGADLVGKRAITAFGIMVDGIDNIEDLADSLDNAGEQFDGAGAAAGMFSGVIIWPLSGLIPSGSSPLDTSGI